MNIKYDCEKFCFCIIRLYLKKVASPTNQKRKKILAFDIHKEIRNQKSFFERFLMRGIHQFILLQQNKATAIIFAQLSRKN